MKKGRRVLCGIMLSWLLLFGASQAEAAQGDLVPVTVKVTIENPDYFWKYPFWGRQLDAIRVYGMGRTVFISPQSAGEAIVFEVPNGYKLKLTLGFQSGAATLHESSYITPWGAGNSDNQAKISLSAPEIVPVKIRLDELESTK